MVNMLQGWKLQPTEHPSSHSPASKYNLGSVCQRLPTILTYVYDLIFISSGGGDGGKKVCQAGDCSSRLCFNTCW